LNLKTTHIVLSKKMKPQSTSQRLKILLVHPREEGGGNRHIIKSLLRRKPQECARAIPSPPGHGALDPLRSWPLEEEVVERARATKMRRGLLALVQRRANEPTGKGT
jgi:hypothetical protein